MSESKGRFLIDTNVISEFVRPKPSLQVKHWFESAEPESLFASVVTFGEIRLGIEDLPAGKRRAALEQWLEEGVPEWFQANLLPVTKAIADRWGQMTIQAKRKGVTISTADGLIAVKQFEAEIAGFGMPGMPAMNSQTDSFERPAARSTCSPPAVLESWELCMFLRPSQYAFA